MLRGIHHLKIAVSDLARSEAFYTRLLGARHRPELDHHRIAGSALYAIIMDVPGLGCLLELRLDAARAERSRGWDPVTLAVEDRHALDRLLAALEGTGAPVSPVLTGLMGWLIVVEDPDGLRVRFYTLESHGGELVPDEDNSWIVD